MLITETERLTLTTTSLLDAEHVYELLNTPSWIKNIGDRGIDTMRDAEKYIQTAFLKSYEKNGFGLYKVSLKANDTFIGFCGFLQRNYLDLPDIGFALLPKYQNKGYTTEAALATLVYGKTKLDIQNVYAITLPNNMASQNVLKKIGLKFTKEISIEEEELHLFSNKPL